MRRKIFLRLLVFFTSIFVSLLITEWLFRLFSNVTKVYYPATWTSPSIYVESSEGYGLLPNKKVKHYSLYKDYIVTYITNSQGLRSARDYLKDKPRNTKRVFIIGDSLVFGIGVNNDETLASRLEEKLNKSSLNDVHYEVLNLGVAGYTFDNCYVRLKKYLEFSPDVIVYVVSGINDFADILDHEFILDKNGDIVAVREKARHIDTYHRFINGPQKLYKKSFAIIENTREFLRRNSVFYAFLGTFRYRNQLNSKKMEERKRNIETEIEGINISRQVLERLFKLANQKQVNTVFILEFFSNPSVKAEFLKYLSQKTNLIIDMNDYSKVRGLYLPGDGHWSRFGNSYIADLVFDCIKDNRVLDPDKKTAKDD